jgi:hypothetical protein
LCSQAGNSEDLRAPGRYETGAGMVTE